MLSVYLDIELVDLYVAAHPEVLLDEDDFEALSANGNVISIAGMEDRSLVNSVVRLRLKRLAMRGMPPKAAAELVGWHPNTVRAIYRDPNFRKDVMQATDAAFDDIDTVFVEEQKSMTEMLTEASFKAFEVLKSGLEHGQIDGQVLSVNQKVKIATDFLDRVEASSKHSTVVKKSSSALEADVLARAAQAGREMDAVRSTKLKRVV